MKINLKNLFKRDKTVLKSEYDRGFRAALEQSEASMDTLRGYYLSQIEDLKKKDLSMWLVDPDWIFAVTKGGLIQLNGEQVTTQELKNLKSEVRALKEFQIYKIMQNTIRQKAIEKAVLVSTDLYSAKGNEQVLGGKMMVYNLDIIQTIMNRIDKAK